MTITASANNWLSSVSCSSNSNFCMAVDNQGYAYAYQNGTWSSTAVNVTHGIALNAVSCPSSTSCTAVDERSNTYTYNGSVWSALQVTPNTSDYGLSSVSCLINPSDTFCMAGNGFDNNYNGNAYISTQPNSTWTATSLSLTNSSLSSVSCSSDQFCMATSGGSVYTYSGNTPTWDTGNYLAYAINLNAVSCASAQFCMSVDTSGNAYVYAPLSSRALKRNTAERSK